jgi:hypothetical protein
MGEGMFGGIFWHEEETQEGAAPVALAEENPRRVRAWLQPGWLLSTELPNGDPGSSR